MKEKPSVEAIAAPEAEEVGIVLADAFLERLTRFPADARERLLIACHQRIAQKNPDVARVLFQGKSS